MHIGQSETITRARVRALSEEPTAGSDEIPAEKKNRLERQKMGVI